MRLVPIVLVAVLCLGAGKDPEITVRVDPCVELMSAIFRLAGSPEYSKARVPAYAAAVDARVGPHRDHEVVKIARDLRARRGVSYDAVMGMAVHLDDLETLKPVVPLDPWPEALDKRWTKEDAIRFLVAARDFAAKTKFAEFVAANEAYYTETAKRIRALVEKDAGLGWCGRYFRQTKARVFTLIPALLNGGMCYGPRVVRDGKEEVFCVLGVWKTDGEGKPRFDRDVLPIVAHEFCHSYVNPFVEKHREKLVPPGERLFASAAQAMKKQAYTDAEIVVKESLVRALVIYYVKYTQGEEAAKKEAEKQVRLSFTWVPRLAEGLNRLTMMHPFAGFERDVDKVAALLEHEAKSVDRVPKIASMTPPNGATDVDPGTTKIRVTFDRPMDRSAWSFVGGGPTFPKATGQAKWSADGKSITLPVKLVPGHRYEFWLNRGKFQGFRSTEGVPLGSVHVTFITKGE